MVLAVERDELDIGDGRCEAPALIEWYERVAQAVKYDGRYCDLWQQVEDIDIVDCQSQLLSGPVLARSRQTAREIWPSAVNVALKTGGY